jgi:hypothetical protein
MSASQGHKQKTPLHSSIPAWPANLDSSLEEKEGKKDSIWYSQLF